MSPNVLELMRREPGRIWISSACPSVVDFIGKYHPECQEAISPLLSPLLTHCKLLRQHHGNGIGVVFIGPCTAKKKEAEQHPELLDVVLTFEDLGRWLDEQNIQPSQITATEANAFEPEQAREGALYPIEGGIIPGVTATKEIVRSQIMAFSGVTNVEQSLKGLKEWKPEDSIFLELTACPDSCVNGPKSARNLSVARRRYEIVQFVQHPSDAPYPRSVDIVQHYAPSLVARAE